MSNTSTPEKPQVNRAGRKQARPKGYPFPLFFTPDEAARVSGLRAHYLAQLRDKRIDHLIEPDFVKDEQTNRVFYPAKAFYAWMDRPTASRLPNLSTAGKVIVAELLAEQEAAQ